MDKRLNPTILDHIRLADHHLNQAKKLVDEGQSRPRSFNSKLKLANQIVGRLHVKEVQYITACIKKMYRTRDYGNHLGDIQISIDIDDDQRKPSTG